MSSATKAALDDALAAHVADECDGAMVNGYVIQVEYVGMAAGRGHGGFRIVFPGQSITMTLGLTQYLSQRLSMDLSRLGH